MDVLALLREYGGSAWSRELLRHCSRRDLAAAVQTGTIVSLRRGRFTLADRGQPARVARALRGVLGLESAAIWHHWAVKEEPLLPVVLVARGRIITDADRRIADVRRTDLPPSDVLGIATSPLRTALDCARSLPYEAALAVADAALRAGDLDRDELLIAARESPRTGRSRAVRVAEAADRRAATAFESVARAISHDVPGLDLVPQVPVLPGVTPDLVDERRRLVVECDSWTYHAEKSAFRRDQERFNAVALAGWLVLRFGDEHALRSPDYVRRVLAEAVALPMTGRRD
jgi:very-short-patch-repair endonuclease